jgi:type II secretory pathway pseudopilin PulG
MNEQPTPGFFRKNWKLVSILILIIIILIAILGIPPYRRWVNGKRALEVRTALESLRGAVDDYWKTNSTISGITIEKALEQAGIGNNTMQKWQFVIAWKDTDLYTTEMVDKLKDVNTNQLVYISPYRMIMAVATAKNPLKEGTKTWFEGDTNSVHGFGVDERVEPDWQSLFPNP